MTPDQGESRPGTGRRVSRREFLRKAAIAGAGALLFGGCACERSPATKAPLPIPTFEPFSGGIGGPEVVTSTPEAIDVLFQKSRWGVPVRLSSSEPPQKGDPLEIGLPFELERLRGLAGKELSPRLEEMYLAIGAWAKEEAVAFRPEDVIMISGPGNSLGAWIVDSSGAVHLMLHDNQGNWYPGLLADSGSAQILESCVLVEAGEGKDRKIQILNEEIVGETLGPGDISGFVYPTVIYGDKADRILIGLEGSRVLAIRVPSRFPMPEDEKIRKDIISEVHPNGGFYFTEAMSGKVIAVLNSWGIEPQWSIGNPKHLFESIPTPTPEAPGIEGLRVVFEDGRIVYRAEAGNEYGLEEGEYAGYVNPIRLGKNVQEGARGRVEFEKKTAVVLDRRVKTKLLEKANTPEAIAQGKWKIALDFDPRNSELGVWEFSKSNIICLAINNLPPNMKMGSPFEVQTKGMYYPQDNYERIAVWLPEGWISEADKDKNYALAFYYKTAKTYLTELIAPLDYGKEIITEINGILPKTIFPENVQLAAVGTTKDGGRSFSINNLLTVDGAIVFSLEK